MRRWEKKKKQKVRNERAEMQNEEKSFELLPVDLSHSRSRLSLFFFRLG